MSFLVTEREGGRSERGTVRQTREKQRNREMERERDLRNLLIQMCKLLSPKSRAGTGDPRKTELVFECEGGLLMNSLFLQKGQSFSQGLQLNG